MYILFYYKVKNKVATAAKTPPTPAPMRTAALDPVGEGDAVPVPLPDAVVGVYCGSVVESTAVVGDTVILAVPSSTVKYVPPSGLPKPASVTYVVKLKR